MQAKSREQIDMSILPPAFPYLNRPNTILTSPSKKQIPRKYTKANPIKNPNTSMAPRSFSIVVDMFYTTDDISCKQLAADKSFRQVSR